jgi:hypothetical protein
MLLNGWGSRPSNIAGTHYTWCQDANHHRCMFTYQQEVLKVKPSHLLQSQYVVAKLTNGASAKGVDLSIPEWADEIVLQSQLSLHHIPGVNLLYLCRTKGVKDPEEVSHCGLPDSY